MADFEKSPTKSKKRKTGSSKEKQKSSKTRRFDHSQNEREAKEVAREEDAEAEQRESNSKIEESSPWRNLQLILSIRDKELDTEAKVQIAYDFVKSRKSEEGDDTMQGFEAVSISRLIVFLSDWVQSLLIPSDKKNTVKAERSQSEVIGSCLDFRCWEIFNFCLEASLKLHVSLKFSRNLLRAIGGLARNALSLLGDMSLNSNGSLFTGKGFELYSFVPNCVLLVFSSHGGLLNDNLDSWISTVSAVLELVEKTDDNNLNSDNVGTFVLRFSCLVLEPFSKFLRVHPCRKNGFRDFIDKLLEPLLHVLGILHLQRDGSNLEWSRKLINSAEEVLSEGLLHHVHIDGFLSLRSTEKYARSIGGQSKGSKTIIKSYHRHLFDKLEKITAAKKVSVSGCLGELLRLLLRQVKKQKGKTGDSRHFEDDFSNPMSKMSSVNSIVISEKSYSASSLSAEMRKSLFDFFVQTMEPLLLEINNYYQGPLEMGPVLLDVHCILRSTNSVLSILMQETIYVRTEDTTDGACLNFLQKVYDIIESFSAKLIQFCQPMCGKDWGPHVEILYLIAEELIVSVGCFVKIEYEVFGNDLIKLWLMLLSFLALGLCMVDAPGQCSISLKIVDLGCQLINLYRDLRQVNNIIIALCKAVRIYVSSDSYGGMNSSEYVPYTTSLSYEASANSAKMLICSQEFRLVIHKAVKFIPEGQASGCIRQIAMDISESLEWLKACFSGAAKRGSERASLRRCSKTSLDLQLEVLGRCLSEMSILVLDSLTVTMGNSTLVASSMKDLMAVIHPCMSNLVGLHQDGVSEFLFSVTGMTSNDKLDGSKNDLLRLGGLTDWAFLFFFRLYLSFRSLYREAISLLPSNSSRTKSAVMEDLIMANSGRDWLQNTDWTDQGYFSCIVHPSASLLLVIQSISDIHFQENVAYCSPLVCVLHAMALQRLVDLNRQIKSFEYLLRRDENLVQVELINGADLSLNHQSRKWERWISDLRQEAAGLTEYIMGFLSLVAKKQQSTNSLDDADCKDVYPQALNENDTWDLSVCDVNEKSLPIAIWWIICQNIDTWCAHAAKKKLKMFLSLLIQSSLSCIEVGKCNISKTNRLRVTVQQISLELLSDTILYEQRCVRRYLAPRFCHILGKSISSLFRGSSYDLSLLPDWSEFLNALDKPSMVVSSDVNVTYDCSSTVPPSSQFLNSACSLTSMEFTACSNLLNLLCWMPKDYLNSKSFPRFASSILNLERLVVGNILDCHDAFDVHHYQLFGLFATCRRALKCLITASCDEMIEASKSSLFPIFFQGFHALWLFKAVSLVVGLQHEFSEDSMSQIKVTIFSLMDHTSYVFLTLSKYQFRLAVHLLVTANKICEEKLNSGVSHEQIKSMEFDSCSDSSKDIDLWNGIILVAETLKEQIEILFTTLKDTSRSGKVEVTNLNKLSTLVSCAQGFLWGLASAISDIDAKDFDGKSNLLKWIQVPISKINLFISVFTDFINHIICTVFVKNDQWPKGICDAQNLLKFDHCKDSSSLGETAASVLCPEGNTSCGKSQVKSEAARSGLASSNFDDESEYSSVPKKRLQSSNADCDASVLTMVDSPELLCLNNPFLRSFLDGTNPEAAYLLRQLFISSSAILRFNLQINCTPFRSSLVPIFIGMSHVLLLELANRVEVPQPLSIACLDGVMKYLEELGNQLPLTTPTLTRNIYAKLIDLHLRAIGKCISLQGKKATLASHETKSSTKTLDGHGGLSEASFSHEPYHLDELKSRLRMSFRTFISKPSELHLLTAIQALERALVGVQGGYTMIYKVSTGSRDGGKVSSVVAAGVDCLDQVLEFASGRKRLNLVKRHIQTLIAGLFNIFLHLQSPLIFYEKLVGSKGGDDPDAGSVILMCIEVLTKISGKHALFQMDTCHVAQSLRIPAALFEGFHMLRLSEASSPPSSLTLMNDLDYDPAASMDAFAIDRHFSLNLYAACCQLLHTILKHHKSECEKCIALLEVSVSVLLQSLETEDTGLSVRKGYFAWEVQEGVRCASFLRRIYEEMRHQKDVFGRYCHKFLSSYIWIYSGYGPLKTGIRREIDEALRPGVYALIDACSADDLQYLHTVFGEGPCRSILATLQHDYKLSFQYGGKV